MHIINSHQAKTSPLKNKSLKRKSGQLRGKIEVAKDFDKLPQSFVKNFAR